MRGAGRERPDPRPITFLYGNVGRDKGPRSTNAADTQLLESLFEACPAERWVVFLAEINEGDDNDELALVEKLMPRGATVFCRRTREPFVASADFAEATGEVVRVPGTSVEHWSPDRSVNLLHLPGEPVTCMGMHHAAGAHGQGDRPARAIAPLNSSWDRLQARKEALSDQLSREGRNVVLMVDANDYDWPRQTGEQTVLHDRTDWGRVRPAVGYAADFAPLPEIPFHLDSHDGHRMRGRFLPRRAPA